MVFYRTYRTQTIADLDSTNIRESLQAIFTQAVKTHPDSAADAIPHAFLFTGPKGLGKTSTARIIAKAVNCERNAFAHVREEHLKVSDSIEPCNSCETCIAITNGNSFDVIEIDAASNRGIDEIRELKEKINLAPAHVRRKVYIIDEVHMLTTEAFNALLKTLEEPPSHAMFILCTTEDQKVPPTILSRCFHMSFQPASIGEITRSLSRIVQGEKIDITADGIDKVAQFAEGGFRDAAKLLEEITALAAGEQITASLIEKKLHITGVQSKVDQLLLLLSQEDMEASIDLIEELVKQKVDLVYFVQLLLQQLHGMLIKQLSRVNETTDGQKFTVSDIQILVMLFSQALKESKQTFLPQLGIEMAVTKWCFKETKEIHKLEESKRNIEQPQKGPILSSDKDGGISVGSLRKELGDIAKKRALYGEDTLAVSSETEQTTVDITSVSLLHFSKDGEITPEWMDAFWKCIIFEMKKINHTTAGVLRSCHIKSFDRKILIIETAYQFHKDRLTETKNLDSLIQICKALIGSPVVVNIELKSK